MTAAAFWRAVARRLDAGAPVHVALVVANTRGSPGTVGARMLVDPAGQCEGTIGGGIMELHAIEAARARLAGDPAMRPRLERLIHRKDAAELASGLLCAGEQTNLELILQPARDGDAVRRFVAALEAQSQAACCLTIDAEGFRVAPQATTDPQFAKRQLVEVDGAWCWHESSVNPQRLAIVGGGHCGRALAKLAGDVGWWVEVFDTRAEALAVGGGDDAAQRHQIDDYARLATTLARPELTRAVVMTTAVSSDIAALAAIAALPLRWLGVMGSKVKLHLIREALAARGIAPERIAAIHGPVGLPMKSDTPPEIAISIMAELLVDTQPATAKR